MSVANRYADLAKAHGDARRQRGSVMGDLVAGLSQVPAQIYARQDAERLARQQQARVLAKEQRDITEATSQQEYRSAQISDLEARREQAKAQAEREGKKAQFEQAEREAKALHGAPLPDVQSWIMRRTGDLWSPDEGQALIEAAQTPEGAARIVSSFAGPAPAKKTQLVTTTDATGKKTTQIVEDVPGATQWVSEPEKKPETRSLELQASEALAKGDTATYQRLLRTIKETATAGRAPVDPTLAAVRQLQLDAANDRAANLPPPVQRRVNQLADAFRNDPSVKRANVTAEGYSFVKAMDPKTQNPADDQALIYAFAKAMDPDSVVREGEYATVQKYAQSWKDKFGFDVARVVSNSEFLTPAARKNLVETIRAKFQASRKSYDNVRKGFATQINKTTGQTDADEYLLDYAGAFPVEEAPPPVPAAGPKEGDTKSVRGYPGTEMTYRAGQWIRTK